MALHESFLRPSLDLAASGARVPRSPSELSTLPRRRSWRVLPPQRRRGATSSPRRRRSQAAGAALFQRPRRGSLRARGSGSRRPSAQRSLGRRRAAQRPRTTLGLASRTQPGRAVLPRGHGAAAGALSLGRSSRRHARELRASQAPRARGPQALQRRAGERARGPGAGCGERRGAGAARRLRLAHETGLLGGSPDAVQGHAQKYGRTALRRRRGAEGEVACRGPAV